MAVRCATVAPARVTANVIEYLPLKSYLQRSAAPVHSRTRSPDPPPSSRSYRRQAIYLELVNSNSKFKDETVFAKAPEFFRTKIGLPKRKKEISGSGDFVSPEKSKKSLYRPHGEQRTACSEFQASKGGTHYYKRGCSGDAAGMDSGTNSKVSVTSSKPINRVSKAKSKPNWKYVGNCKDSFTSFKDYCSPVEHTCRRSNNAKTSKNKRPLENSRDENCRSCSSENHKAKTLYRSKKERADDSVEQVFAVNGAVVSFKGFEYQNFTNWFADPIRTTGKQPCAYRKVLNFTGYTNREIVMKVYNGNKLVIEGSRPCRGNCMAQTLKEVIDLPTELPIESLFMSRTPQGILIIERAPSNVTATKRS